MKISLDQEDIQAIAVEVLKTLKPFLGGSSKTVQQDNIFDVAELASYLGVDPSWVYRQVSLRNIPYFKVGKYPRFKKSEIDKWITKNTTMPIPPLKLANKCR